MVVGAPGGIRHIIWDWNGTLLNDTGLTVRSAMAALDAIGQPKNITIEMWRQISTRPLRNIYTSLVDVPIEAGQWQVLEQTWLSTYVAGLPAVALNPMARQALDQAASAGMTQSIVSLHTEPELRADVQAKGIANVFTSISGSRRAGNVERTPKAAEVRSQLADLRVDPAQAIMIGDMVDDAREADEAGVRAVLVPTGDTSRERLVASGYPVADSLTDAVRLITG